MIFAGAFGKVVSILICAGQKRRHTIMNKKVVVFGDSISRGIVSEGDKLVRLEADAASLIEKQYGYEISNKSRFGLSLKRLCEKRTVEAFIEGGAEDVDIAVLCIGGNDADYNWEEVGKTPWVDHQPYTSPEEFGQLLCKTVELLQGRGISVLLCTIPPVDSQRYFDNVICKRADGERVLEFLNGDVSNISRHQEVYNYVIIGCARRYSCPIIDLRTGFLLDRFYLSNYCADGIHPNGSGHKFMAEQIVSSLARQGVYLQKRV